MKKSIQEIYKQSTDYKAYKRQLQATLFDYFNKRFINNDRMTDNSILSEFSDKELQLQFSVWSDTLNGKIRIDEYGDYFIYRKRVTTVFVPDPVTTNNKKNYIDSNFEPSVHDIGKYTFNYEEKKIAIVDSDHAWENVDCESRIAPEVERPCFADPRLLEWRLNYRLKKEQEDKDKPKNKFWQAFICFTGSPIPDNKLFTFDKKTGKKYPNGDIPEYYDCTLYRMVEKHSVIIACSIIKGLMKFNYNKMYKSLLQDAVTSFQRLDLDANIDACFINGVDPVTKELEYHKAQKLHKSKKGVDFDSLEFTENFKESKEIDTANYFNGNFDDIVSICKCEIWQEISDGVIYDFSQINGGNYFLYRRCACSVRNYMYSMRSGQADISESTLPFYSYDYDQFMGVYSDLKCIFHSLEYEDKLLATLYGSGFTQKQLIDWYNWHCSEKTSQKQLSRQLLEIKAHFEYHYPAIETVSCKVFFSALYQLLFD